MFGRDQRVDQDKVEIDGVQYGATERLRDAIQVDIVAVEDSVQIRAIRPLESHGTWGEVRHQSAQRVNLDRIVTSNGHIKLDDIEGVMRVRTSNGQVQAARGAATSTCRRQRLDRSPCSGRSANIRRATVRSMPTFAARCRPRPRTAASMRECILPNRVVR